MAKIFKFIIIFVFLAVPVNCLAEGQTDEKPPVHVVSPQPLESVCWAEQYKQPPLTEAEIQNYCNQIIIAANKLTEPVNSVYFDFHRLVIDELKMEPCRYFYIEGKVGAYALYKGGAVGYTFNHSPLDPTKEEKALLKQNKKLILKASKAMRKLKINKVQ